MDKKSEEFKKPIEDIKETIDNLKLNEHKKDAIEKNITFLKNTKKIATEEAKRNKKIRNLKIFTTNMKRFVPYVVVTGLTTMIYTINYNNPFSKDVIEKEYLDYIDYANNNGIERRIDVNEDEKHEKSTHFAILREYSKWNQNAEGSYYRVKSEYDVSGVDKKTLDFVIQDKNLSLDKVYGESFKEEFEKKENLTSEQLDNNKNYREYFIGHYHKEKLKESNMDCFINFWLYFCVLYMFNGAVFLLRWFKFDFKKKKIIPRIDYYKSSINKIKNQYPDLSFVIDDIDRQIFESKKEYKKLVRK